MKLKTFVDTIKKYSTLRHLSLDKQIVVFQPRPCLVTNAEMAVTT